MKCRLCEELIPKGKVRCIRCRAWNAVPESSLLAKGVDDGTELLSDVSELEVKRLTTGPWDINFADPPGVPDDAVILIGGEPGVGKSTMALQWSNALARSSKRECLYVGAEEGNTQVKSRAVRLELSHLNLIRLLARNKMGNITLEQIVERHNPCGVVVDSMPGFTDDMNEAVELCKAFKELALKYRTPFIVIDHITKSGDMAGLESLQHAVDITCLATKTEKDVECDVYYPPLPGEDVDEVEIITIIEMRELYTKKSRYGPSGQSTLYHMTATGLKEVKEVPDEDEDDDE